MTKFLTMAVVAVLAVGCATPPPPVRFSTDSQVVLHYVFWTNRHLAQAAADKKCREHGKRARLKHQYRESYGGLFTVGNFVMVYDCIE